MINGGEVEGREPSRGVPSMRNWGRRRGGNKGRGTVPSLFVSSAFTKKGKRGGPIPFPSFFQKREPRAQGQQLGQAQEGKKVGRVALTLHLGGGGPRPWTEMNKGKEGRPAS